MKPVVFAISAVPGGGKTSLAARLRSRLPDSLVLSHDDYAVATTWSIEAIAAWFARGGDCNEFDCSALVERLEGVLTDRASPTALFLETHFGRRHVAIRPFVDKLVWIDVPLDIALARQMRAFARDALHQPAAAADQLRWQVQYLEHYQRDLQRMYRRQRDDLLPDADLVIDGSGAPEQIADAALSFVSRTLRG